MMGRMREVWKNYSYRPYAELTFYAYWCLLFSFFSESRAHLWAWGTIFFGGMGVLFGLLRWLRDIDPDWDGE